MNLSMAGQSRIRALSGKGKYGNRKTTLDGITFDSVKEANRWVELKLMERTHLIRELQRQVPYTLIPSQYDEKGKCVERECKYVADFVYEEPDEDKPGAWRTVVEDAKGMRTDVYKIKRKLMLKEYGIRIQEV